MEHGPLFLFHTTTTIPETRLGLYGLRPKQTRDSLRSPMLQALPLQHPSAFTNLAAALRSHDKAMLSGVLLAVDDLFAKLTTALLCGDEEMLVSPRRRAEIRMSTSTGTVRTFAGW